MALPPEILKKVKLLEISTRKIVNNLFAGQYHTHFKGQGMTFADFREYVPGDDVRSISWPLTAKTGTTYIKKYEEERELTLILAVDISASTLFGTTKNIKAEVIAQLAALLAFAAVKNNDQIGLLLFTNQVEHFVPPKKGRGQVLRILRDLFYFKPKSQGTNISVACQHLQSLLKKRATIFFFSDFLDNSYDKNLRRLCLKHEVVACVIEDPAEEIIPSLGLIQLSDSETGEFVLVDTSSKNFQNTYALQRKENKTVRDKNLRGAQVARVDIRTDTDYVIPLVNFFAQKRRIG